MPFALRTLDLPVLALGAALTLALAAATGPLGTMPVLALAGLAAMLAMTAAFVIVPHVAIAAAIPVFAVLPTVRTLFVESAGPLKDLIVIAAVGAACVVGLAKMKAGRGTGVDRWIGIPAAAVVGLYVVNLGGLTGDGYDLAWAHGVRLTAEPILLLGAGLVLGGRRTLRWAVVSLVVTGVGVALYGLWQQYVGQWHLVGMGYSFEHEVRTIDGRLRSFGTLDESFAYAAFLLFPLAALVFLPFRRRWAVAAGAIVLAGITVAFVRSAAIAVIALAALWALRRGHVVQSAFLLGASAAAAVAIVVSSTGATESHTVQAEPSLYLTINGRTEVWKVALQEPSSWPLGQGVGQVGTAAERASINVSRSEPGRMRSAVDSAYFATIADIGFLGLAVRLVLLGALVTLAWRAARAGLHGGWFALSLLTVLLLDGLTRDSFTGFPTAFLGLLLVGLALAAAREQQLGPGPREAA